MGGRGTGGNLGHVGEVDSFQEMNEGDGDASGTHVKTTIRYVGDYLLLGRLGKGSMGEVWVARQTTLRKTVAIKLIRPEHLESEGARARFVAEAKAASRVLHPNIVTLFEFGNHEGTLFLAMQYVEGEDLAVRMAGRRLTVRESVRLLSKAARAVHHAHQNSLVHRDLKPANILVDENLEPYLTDFGVAKRLDEGPALTRAGDVVGTPHYMAPEQAMGHEAITTAVDIWSLGAVLFEMLAGQRLWSGDEATVLARLVTEEPRRLAQVGRDVDRDLDTICHACLTRAPERRYASAAALAEDLERWLRGEPILARPVGAVERTWKWVRRKPTQASLVGLLVFGALAWVGLELSRARVARIENHRLLMSRADASFRQGEDTQGYATLGRLMEIHPESPAPKARLLSAIAYRPLARPALPPLAHGAPVNAVEFSPDDRRIATAGANAEVVLWDAETGARLGAPLACGGSVSGVRFIDDRRLLSFGGGGSVEAWWIGAGDRRKLWTKTLPGTVHWAESSPDGSVVYAAEEQGSLVRLNADSGDALNPGLVLTRGLYSAALSRDGQFVAAGDVRGGLVVVRTRDFSEAHRSQQGLEAVSALAFSPTRDLLISAGADGSLRRTSLEGDGEGEGRSDLTVEFGVSAIRFSPDGRYLLVGREDGVVDVVNVESWTRLSLRSPVRHGGPVTGLAVVGQEPVAVSADGFGEIRLWDLRDGRPVAGPIRMSTWVAQVALGNGGARLGAGSFDGTAGVWELAPADRTVRIDREGAWIPRSSEVNAVALSKAGVAVVGRENGEILLRDPGSTGAVESLTRLASAVQSLEFSADSRRLLAACADGTASLWDVQEKRLIREFVGHSGIVWRAIFGIGEQTVITHADDDTVRLWNVTNGQEVDRRSSQSVVGGAESRIIEMAFDATRSVVAVSTEGRATYTWRLATPGREWTRFAYEAPHQAVGLSPDGRVLVVGCKTGELLVWDTLDAARPPVVERMGAPILHLAWSPGGTRLAVGMTSGEVMWVEAGRWGSPSLLGKLSGNIHVLGFAGSDSRLVAAAQGGDAQAWSLPDGWPWSERLVHPQSVYCAATSVGGEWMLTGCNDGRARLWRLAWPEFDTGQLAAFADALGRRDHRAAYQGRGMIDALNRALDGGGRAGAALQR